MGRSISRAAFVLAFFGVCHACSIGPQPEPPDLGVGAGGASGSGAGGYSGSGTAGTSSSGGYAGAGVGGSGGAATAGSGGTSAKGGAAGATGGQAGKAGAGVGGKGGGMSGSGGATGGKGGSGGASGGMGGSGGSSGCTATDPTVDADKDGYFPPEDCNDCDPNINPGAIDVVTTDNHGLPLPPAAQVAENCGPKPVQPNDDVSCDDGLQLTDPDAIHGANAIELCALAKGTKKPGTPGADYTYGIVSAKYQQLDATPLPVGAQVGYGIQAAWGDVVVPRRGKSMLVLSSGTARLPKNTKNAADQPGYQDPAGADEGYATANPTGLPFSPPSCPSSVATDLHDSVSLHLTLRAPTNARSCSFQLRFTTYEFPANVCSAYDDVFLARMVPPPPGALPAMTNNLTFDALGNPLGIDHGFFDVCAPGTMAGGMTFPCVAGAGDLVGTGYEMHAATSWLQTNAPVTPGETFELDFGVADASNGLLASTVLLDAFTWSASPATVITDKSCSMGGTGTCPACLDAASASTGCCAASYLACTAEGASGCSGILGCVGQCAAGDAPCQQACVAAHPSGKPSYDALLACSYGDMTAAKKGACGVACGFATP